MFRIRGGGVARGGHHGGRLDTHVRAIDLARHSLMMMLKLLDETSVGRLAISTGIANCVVVGIAELF